MFRNMRNGLQHDIQDILVTESKAYELTPLTLRAIRTRLDKRFLQHTDVKPPISFFTLYVHWDINFTATYLTKWRGRISLASFRTWSASRGKRLPIATPSGHYTEHKVTSVGTLFYKIFNRKCIYLCSIMMLSENWTNNPTANGNGI